MNAAESEDRSSGKVLPPSGERGEAIPGARILAMYVFLVSLTMLFAASMVGYLVVRSRAAEWRPEGAAALPAGLWASTAVLLLSSATMHWALRSARRGRPIGLRVGLMATFGLGGLFLGLQTLNWLELVSEHVTPTTGLYGFTFYVLTGLHAIHVIGGLIPLGITTARAFLGRYGWARYSGVRNVAVYWHFLDVVWIVMFTALQLGS